MHQQVVALSSRFRDSGTFNECHINLPRSLIDVESIEVAGINIPNSGNIFNSNNNTIIFTEGGGNLTATITEGSYTETLLCTEIKTRLDAAGALTYTVTIPITPSITKKLRIAATGAFTILSLSNGTTAGKRLGYTNTLHTSVANVITADYPVYLSPPAYLLISISNLGMNEIIFGGPYSVGHQIIAINVGDSYTMSPFLSESTFKIKFKNLKKSIRDVDISIYDPEHNYELQQDWVIVLSAITCRLC